MNLIAKDILAHVGVSKLDGAPIGSGRFPLGSGENPNQHFHDIYGRIRSLEAQGLSEKEIALAMGYKSTTELRDKKRVAGSSIRREKVEEAERLKAEGKNNTEIARIMGFENESSVRSLLNARAKAKMNEAETTARYLKEIVDQKGMVDVGTGVELELNISKEKLRAALDILAEEGYETYGGRVPQVTDANRMTTLKVLTPPGTEHKDIYNYENIHTVSEYDKILTDDGAAIRPAFHYPASMDSKRLEIKYAEDGGIDKDGVIELRRGVPDLSLGNSHYAQVRILVDGDRYLKGMAVYADDLPDGIDVRFNTNKPKGTDMRNVLKEIDAGNPENPFGSLIKERGGQSYYDDPNGEFTDPVTGKRQSLSLINKRADEGDWGEWSKDIPSQFLSKQPIPLASQQLKMSKADRAAQLEMIEGVTVPEVRKKMLLDFADNCDSGARSLQAAAFPGQKYQVILPMTTLKDNEVYAPNFKDGSEVALVRFPHSGPFETPILKVNNRNKEGRQVLGTTPKDAVGITKAVADRLSGADFDGDTVLVIPLSDRVQVHSAPQLFDDFDPKIAYGYSEVKTDSAGNKTYYRNGEAFKLLSKGQPTQLQMGMVSNLITDMTILGAQKEELARAVRHSMVVIDAAKHKLDYKASEVDNGIDELKRKYQVQPNGKYGGASTLLSRAKSETTVDKRQGSVRIDPETGEKYYKESDNLWYAEKKPVYATDENGKRIRGEDGKYVIQTDENGRQVWQETGVMKKHTQASTKMDETSDAMTLVSEARMPMEVLYADYANYLKMLGNEARKEAIATPASNFSRSAYETYRPEVDSINEKLRAAKMNAPRERQAQLIASSRAKALYDADPSRTKEQRQKDAQRALASARDRLGAKRTPVKFTDREWEAILAGAVNHTRLTEIIKYADADVLRELTMPRLGTDLSPAQQAKIRAMQASGYTSSDIADAVGISTSTVSRYLD